MKTFAYTPHLTRQFGRVEEGYFLRLVDAPADPEPVASGKPIGQLVKEWEQDPRKKAALDRAREKVKAIPPPEYDPAEVAFNAKSPDAETWFPMSVKPPKDGVYRVRRDKFGVQFAKYIGYWTYRFHEISEITDERCSYLSGDNPNKPTDCEWSPIPTARDPSAWRPFSEVPEVEGKYEIGGYEYPLFAWYGNGYWHDTTGVKDGFDSPRPDDKRSYHIYYGNKLTGWPSYPELKGRDHGNSRSNHNRPAQGEEAGMAT